jgi:phage-related protein
MPVRSVITISRKGSCMGWIFVLIVSFLGYQYVVNSPTITSGLQTIKSVASGIESVASSTRQVAGAGVEEAGHAAQMLPPDLRSQFQSASQQVTSSLPTRSGSPSGCGQADSLGNIKYCFNR